MRYAASFAGPHLSDATLMQNDAADELDVELAHAEHAPSGLAHDRKGLGQQLVEGLAVRVALTEFARLRAQRFVRQCLHRGLVRIDLRDQRPATTQISFVPTAEQAAEKLADGHDLPGEKTQ